MSDNQFTSNRAVDPKTGDVVRDKHGLTGAKDLVGNAVLTPTQAGNCTGSRIGMFANNVENWSEKRLVQTSPPHNNTLEALDSAQALKCMNDCEYVYVTEDNRVVSIWTYNDATPNKPVARGQKRVLIPAYSKKK